VIVYKHRVAASQRTILVAALVLAGCATATKTVYQHPVTREKAECVKPAPKGGIPGMYGLIDAPALDRYSECKSGLEAKGYVRTAP
jgi:hypothetical protein